MITRESSLSFESIRTSSTTPLGSAGPSETPQMVGNIHELVAEMGKKNLDRELEDYADRLSEKLINEEKTKDDKRSDFDNEDSKKNSQEVNISEDKDGQYFWVHKLFAQKAFLLLFYATLGPIPDEVFLAFVICTRLDQDFQFQRSGYFVRTSNKKTLEFNKTVGLRDGWKK